MKDEKKKNPTKITLVIRIAAAVYLLYLAWRLRTAPAAHEGLQKIFFIMMMIVFVVIAATVGGISLKALLNGEYDDSGEEP